MAKKLLQVNFTFDGTRDMFEEVFMPVAQPIADQQGLKWKVWVWNDESRECGGEYLFDDDAAVGAYLEGPIVAQVKEHPKLSNLSVKVFDVVENPTAVTRGPI
jgi:putative monooxygenase ydhR